MRLLALALAATLFSTAAFGPTAVFGQSAAMKTFAAAADIPALIAKAKAERKGDQPLVIVPMASVAPYSVSLEYRPGTSPAAVHEKDAEMMVVLEGSGTIVTGGKLVDEKRTNAANLNGSSIADGKPQAVTKGDLLIVPENTPHQVIPSGGPIVLMTMHVPRPAPANWP